MTSSFLEASGKGDGPAVAIHKDHAFTISCHSRGYVLRSVQRPFIREDAKLTMLDCSTHRIGRCLRYGIFSYFGAGRDKADESDLLVFMRSIEGFSIDYEHFSKVFIRVRVRYVGPFSMTLSRRDCNEVAGCGRFKICSPQSAKVRLWTSVYIDDFVTRTSPEERFTATRLCAEHNACSTWTPSFIYMLLTSLRHHQYPEKGSTHQRSRPSPGSPQGSLIPANSLMSTIIEILSFFNHQKQVRRRVIPDIRGREQCHDERGRAQR